MIPSVGCSEVPIDFISKDGGSFFLFPPRMKNSIIESVISKEPKRRRKRRGVRRTISVFSVAMRMQIEKRVPQK